MSVLIAITPCELSIPVNQDFVLPVGKKLLINGWQKVLKNFPGLKVLLVHSGGKVDFYDEVIELVKKHETLYMDFSGDCFYPPVFKKILMCFY